MTRDTPANRARINAASFGSSKTYTIPMPAPWPFGTIVRPLRGDERRLMVLAIGPQKDYFSAMRLNDGEAGKVAGGFPLDRWEPDT